MDEIKRADHEIEGVLQACEDAEMNGSRYPNMSYEQGILDFVEWLTREIAAPFFD